MPLEYADGGKQLRLALWVATVPMLFHPVFRAWDTFRAES
jgi:hypothetical protein